MFTLRNNAPYRKTDKVKCLCSPPIGEKYQHKILFTVYIDMCAYRYIVVFVFWQIEQHAGSSYQTIEIDEEYVTVLVAEHICQYTEWDTHTHTADFNCFPISTSFPILAFTFTCICACVYVFGWMLRLNVLVWHKAFTSASSAKTRFVCFGYCQLLFWFMSWCFWTTLSPL